MRRRLGLLLVVAILLVGCSTYEREMVPPKIDLGSSRRIAVLFFLIILRMIILWYMKSKSDYLKSWVSIIVLPSLGRLIGHWPGLDCGLLRRQALNRPGVWVNC